MCVCVGVHAIFFHQTPLFFFLLDWTFWTFLVSLNYFMLINTHWKKIPLTTNGIPHVASGFFFKRLQMTWNVKKIKKIFSFLFSKNFSNLSDTRISQVSGKNIFLKFFLRFKSFAIVWRDKQADFFFSCKVVLNFP